MFASGDAIAMPSRPATCRYRIARRRLRSRVGGPSRKNWRTVHFAGADIPLTSRRLYSTRTDPIPASSCAATTAPCALLSFRWARAVKSSV